MKASVRLTLSAELAARTRRPQRAPQEDLCAVGAPLSSLNAPLITRDLSSSVSLRALTRTLTLSLMCAQLLSVERVEARPKKQPRQPSRQLSRQPLQERSEARAGLSGVEFKVIDISRPLSRVNRRLSAPRRVTLFASRPPLPSELGLSQGAQPWLHQELEVVRLSPLEVDEGALLSQEAARIERLSALTARQDEAHRQRLASEAARFVRERVSPSAARATEGVTARSTETSEAPQDAQSADQSADQTSTPSPALDPEAVAAARAQMEAVNEGLQEQGEDDDELSALLGTAEDQASRRAAQASPSSERSTPSRETTASAELPATRQAERAAEPLVSTEGQLCGQEGQPCCAQGLESPCAAALLCQPEPVRSGGQEGELWRCLPAPPPCGGYQQACCEAGELSCTLDELTCSAGRCLLSPLPTPTKQLKVGRLKITGVKGRFIEAEVTADRLTKRAQAPMTHALMVGDVAR